MIPRPVPAPPRELLAPAGPTSMWINFAGLGIFLAIFAHNLWMDRRAKRGG